MAPRYDEAPEVAPGIHPELHTPPSAPEVSIYEPQPSYAVFKNENSTINQNYVPIAQQVDGTTTYGYVPSTYVGGAAPEGLQNEKASRRVCGCSLLVFILSAIIALLSVAVIGLAAGTGIASNRANEKQSQLDVLGASGTATTTGSAASATSTGAAVLDRGCSTNSATVTGSNYTTQFFDRPTYQIYCNNDTPSNVPLYSLFVGNFDDCIDACAHWVHYVPSDFNSSSTSNNTCTGLSFIPLWTDRGIAFDGGAPGNCYLKTGPLNRTSLKAPTIGTPVHSAILVGD